ncbi:hypothetical protein ACFLTB_01030 [Chloroflexota bacterium]
MTTSIAIFSKVNDYLEKRLSLWELESWLASMLNIYLSNPNSEAAELAGAIELGLSEINDNVKTERGLRRSLRDLLKDEPINSVSYQDYYEKTFAYSDVSTTDATVLELIDPQLSWCNEPQVEYVS